MVWQHLQLLSAEHHTAKTEREAAAAQGRTVRQIIGLVGWPQQRDNAITQEMRQAAQGAAGWSESEGRPTGISANNTFYLDQPKPEGDWIGWKAWMELAGSHHVGPSVALFAVLGTGVIAAAP